MIVELLVALSALSLTPEECGHGSVFFDRGAPPTLDAKVTDAQNKALECNLDWLKKFPGGRLTIIPRVSSSECNRDCFELSNRRAQFVQRWFLERGVAENRIDIVPKAATTVELDDNADDMPRDQFARRVEFYPHD